MKTKIVLILLTSISTISQAAASTALRVPVSIIEQLVNGAKCISLNVNYGAEERELSYDDEGFFTQPHQKKSAKTKRTPAGTEANKTRLTALEFAVTRDITIGRAQNIEARRYPGEFELLIEATGIPDRSTLTLRAKDPAGKTLAEELLSRLVASKIREDSTTRLPWVIRDLEVATALVNGSSDIGWIQQIIMDQAALATLPAPDEILESKAAAYVRWLQELVFQVMDNAKLKLWEPAQHETRVAMFDFIYQTKWNFQDDNRRLSCFALEPIPQETYDLITQSTLTLNKWLAEDVIFFITQIPHSIFQASLQTIAHQSLLQHMFSHGHFDRNPMPGKSYFELSIQQEPSIGDIYKILSLSFEPDAKLYTRLTEGAIQVFVKFSDCPPIFSEMKCWNRRFRTYTSTNTFSFIVAKSGVSSVLKTLHPDFDPSTMTDVHQLPVALAPTSGYFSLPRTTQVQRVVNDIGVSPFEVLLALLSEKFPNASFQLQMQTRNMVHRFTLKKPPR
ncbi:MAG: hypothetical protein LBE97_02830 [Holosporales bacterium]|jgi:hypothetical protein|nr:hypothetical protein [Holosporales bacterium]